MAKVEIIDCFEASELKDKIEAAETLEDLKSVLLLIIDKLY